MLKSVLSQSLTVMYSAKICSRKLFMKLVLERQENADEQRHDVGAQQHRRRQPQHHLPDVQ